MYCRNCGSRLPDSARFCGECGTPVAAAPRAPVNPAPVPAAPVTRKRGFGRWILKILVLGLVIAGIDIYTSDSGSGSSSVKKDPDTFSVPAVTVQTAPALPQKPENGWYEEGGNRYYYSDGQPLTGIWDIGGQSYFFNDRGVMASNVEVTYNDNTLEIGSDGVITGMVLPGVSGNWSSEHYRYGNSGKASIMELESVVENCDRTGFYIEAEGNYGASMTCNWKIFVRSHGSWVFAGEYYYTEPSGYFELHFADPIDFDAVTAYPTVTGNASYTCYFAPVDIHVLLY